MSRAPRATELGLAVIDELALGREHEPVEMPIGDVAAGALAREIALLDDSQTGVPTQVTAVDSRGSVTPSSRLVFLTSLPSGIRERRYLLRVGEQAQAETTGIRLLDPVTEDGFRRLDTGRFELELCRGTARPENLNKWGIRHFEDKSQGLNLIRENINSMGGVFGPYFTPENGYVYPPLNSIADVKVLEEGPLLCRYRFDVEVPDGLDPRLTGSRIDIVWSFFSQSCWFDRQYHVTPFETVVDGIPVANKITVGDEFEGGKGNLLFSRFAAWPETVYRDGDPHGQTLCDLTRELLAGRQGEPGLDRYRRAAERGLEGESYELRVRLFFLHDHLTPVELIEKYLGELQRRAGTEAREQIVEKGLKRSGEVNVSEELDETAFVRTANKTLMSNPETGYSVLWYTSSPVRRYQIVQSRRFGWINWGTNGENEFPELPSGSLIRMSYGRFEEPWVQAQRMESPVVPQWIR